VFALESVHGEVLSREEVLEGVHINVKVDPEKLSYEERAAYFRFKIMKYSRVYQIAVSGRLLVHADNEDELEELKAYVEKKKPPIRVINAVIARSQPLILHIEEEFQVPIIPIPPPPPPPEKLPQEQKRQIALTYQ